MYISKRILINSRKNIFFFFCFIWFGRILRKEPNHRYYLSGGKNVRSKWRASLIKILISARHWLPFPGIITVTVLFFGLFYFHTFFSHFNHRSFNIWFPRHATNALGPRIPRLRGTIRVPWVVPTWKTKTPGNSVIKAIDLPSGILLIVNSYSQKFPA